MKPVPAGFVDWILSAQRMCTANLYTFEFTDGSFAYFNDIDMDLTIDGTLFSARSLRIDGLRQKVAVGLNVDEQEVRINAFPEETLGSTLFFGGIQQGLLDGAYITRQRAFWEVVDGRPYIDFQSVPKGVITIFIGLVSQITKIGRSHVEMKVKSPLKLLDMDMPRNSFQPSCLWTLYDNGCTLNRATYTTNFTVSAANTLLITPTIPIPTPTGADGLPSYYQGRLLFLTGVNAGFQTIIADNDGTNFRVQYPLNVVPDPGDTFSAAWGCAKTVSACEDKFSNRDNFRGFPRVPPVVVSL